MWLIACWQVVKRLHPRIIGGIYNAAYINYNETNTNVYYLMYVLENSSFLNCPPIIIIKPRKMGGGKAENKPTKKRKRSKNWYFFRNIYFCLFPLSALAYVTCSRKSNPDEVVGGEKYLSDRGEFKKKKRVKKEEKKTGRYLMAMKILFAPTFSSKKFKF